MLRAIALPLLLCSFGMLAQCNLFRPNDDADGMMSLDQHSDEDCSMDVTDAKAWINRMPGPISENGPTLQIMLRIKGQTVPLRLSRSDATTDQTLVLDLATASDERLGLTAAGYRETAPNPLYESVRVLCNGKEIVHITDIKTVS